MPRVLTVDHVHIGKDPGGKGIIIAASGTVSSSGWSDPHLEPWRYINSPADGIQDLDFLAEPPGGVSLQVITPIAISTQVAIDIGNYWGPNRPLLGLRVHGTANSFEARLDGEGVFVATAGGDPRPWPWSRVGPSALDQIPLEQIIGSRLRVYHTGDALNLDYWQDRLNVELSPSTDRIVAIRFG